MLAIGRADRKQVRFHWDGQSNYVFDAVAHRWGRTYPSLSVRVPSGVPRDASVESWKSDGYALIPMVPADVRPNVALNKAHVLWEVPEWADSRITNAPTDPYLIQHLAGSLWVVLAEWDLTPLERAITRGRIEP